MAAHRLDAVFVGGGTNLTYFTTVGWGTSERTFGAVLNRKGRPIWVCPAFELERAKEIIPAGQEVRTWEEHESPYALIGGIVNDLGGRRLGTGARTSSAFQIYGLRRDAAGIELADGAVVTDGCRGTKTAKEIAYLDLANRITKLAFREGFKPDPRGHDAPRSVRRPSPPPIRSWAPAAAAGRSSARTRPSPTARGRRAPSRTAPSSWSTAAAGSRATAPTSPGRSSSARPTDKMVKVWDIVRKAQAAALKAARPGATCESVDAAARKVIEDAGLRPGLQIFRPPRSATASAWRGTNIPTWSRATPSSSSRA